MNYVWVNKNGEWLTFSERTTHTGTHYDVEFTNDLNKATLTHGPKLPNNIERGQWELLYIPANVATTRIVTLNVGV